MPANIGHVTMPEQETAGYATHPALGDACIHLAAVLPAHADSVRMRSVTSSRMKLLITFIQLWHPCHAMMYIMLLLLSMYKAACDMTVLKISLCSIGLPCCTVI